MEIYQPSIILLVAQVAVTTFLFYYKKQINLPRLLIVSQILCLSFIYIIGMLITLSYHRMVEYLAGLDFILGMTLGPIVYLYTISYLKDEKTINRSYLNFFIIPLVFLLTMIAAELFIPDFFRNFTSSTLSYHRFVIATHLIGLVHLLVYLVFSFIYYLKFLRQQGIRNAKLKAIGFYLRGFLIISLILMHLIIAGGILVKIILPPLAIIIFYTGIGWYNRIILRSYENGSRRKIIEETKSVDLESEFIYSYLETNKPYINKHFKLEHLARQLNLNRNQLSHIINHKIGISFSELINLYRVKEVQNKLTDPKYQNFTIEAIAREVGFNSRACFYDIFKKQTGMTPSEYRQQSNIIER